MKLFLPKLLTGLFLAAISQCILCQDIKNKADTGPKLLIGGEIRTRMRSFRGINFGDVSDGENDYDTYINIRGSISAEARISRNLKFHSQLYSANTLFKDELSGSDMDYLAVSQLYSDITFKSAPVNLRLGRQQLNFGSGKILGTSDNPNVPKNFDGFRATLKYARLTADVLAFMPYTINEGVFDNYIGANNFFYGTYLTITTRQEEFLDIYLFGNNLTDVEFCDEVGDESRVTIGSRYGKISGNIMFDAEAAWQSGTIGNKSISSFFISASAGLNWKSPKIESKILVRGSIYSGDKDSTDKRLSFFRPVYSRPPVNNMAPFGPSNIILLVPEAGFVIKKNLEVTLRYFNLWRFSKNDGLYSNRLDQMSRDPDRIGDLKGRFATAGFNLQVEYSVNNKLNVALSTGEFFAREYIQNTGNGKNVKATFLTVIYGF